MAKQQNTIDSLKRDIDASIEAVAKIPKVSTEQFSSEELKNEVIPILEEAKNRITGVETITNDIDAVRDEIILPVNRSIRQTSRVNVWFSIFGLVVGLVGICLALLSFASMSARDPARLTNQLRKSAADLEKNNESLRHTISELENSSGLPQATEDAVSKDSRPWYTRLTAPRYEGWYWWLPKILVFVGILIAVFFALGLASENDSQGTAIAVCVGIILMLISLVWL